MIGPKGGAAEIAERLNVAKAGIETYPPAESGDYLKQDVERYRSFQSELGERLTR